MDDVVEVSEVKYRTEASVLLQYSKIMGVETVVGVLRVELEEWLPSEGEGALLPARIVSTECV